MANIIENVKTKTILYLIGLLILIILIFIFIEKEEFQPPETTIPTSPLTPEATPVKEPSLLLKEAREKFLKIEINNIKAGVERIKKLEKERFKIK